MAVAWSLSCFLLKSPRRGFAQWLGRGTGSRPGRVPRRLFRLPSLDLHDLIYVDQDLSAAQKLGAPRTRMRQHVVQRLHLLVVGMVCRGDRSGGGSPPPLAPRAGEMDQSLR